MTAAAQPAHGAERNRHMHREQSSIDLKTASGERQTLTYTSSELSVAEKYCSHCNEWVSTKPIGILGFLWCPQCKSSW